MIDGFYVFKYSDFNMGERIEGYALFKRKGKTFVDEGMPESGPCELQEIATYLSMKDILRVFSIDMDLQSRRNVEFGGSMDEDVSYSALEFDEAKFLLNRGIGVTFMTSLDSILRSN